MEKISLNGLCWSDKRSFSHKMTPLRLLIQTVTNNDQVQHLQIFFLKRSLSHSYIGPWHLQGVFKRNLQTEPWQILNLIVRFVIGSTNLVTLYVVRDRILSCSASLFYTIGCLECCEVMWMQLGLKRRGRAGKNSVS